MRRLICTLAILTICSSGAAATGIPDLDQSYWTCRTDDEVVVIVCPAGDGMTLDAAWPTSGGEPVDATIDLWVIDGTGYPVWMYPFEDLWLESPGFGYCPGGTCAETNTDATGHTTFRALSTGGHAIGDIAVLISGSAVTGSAPNLRLVSPDMSGDGIVNLTDVFLFSGPFFGDYDPAADFDGDGDVDLSDLVFMTRHEGHACP